MKKFILFFAILALTATLPSCTEKMEPNPVINTGTSAKYPGVGAAIYNRFVDMASAHPGTSCYTAELDQMVNYYVTGCGEFTPYPDSVALVYDHNGEDVLNITFLGVTHKFYKDGTTTWDQGIWPGESANRGGIQSEKINPSK